MQSCALTVWSVEGFPVAGGSLDLPQQPSQAMLDRVWRSCIQGVPCRHASIRQGQDLRAVFVDQAFLPSATVRFAGPARAAGRWLTSSLSLVAPGTGRAWVGPEVFLRQVDLGGPDAWLVPTLLGLGSTCEVNERLFGRVSVHEWQIDGCRYLYTARGSRWRLYGSGNTPQPVVERVLREESPSNARSYLWSLGAVRLA